MKKLKKMLMLSLVLVLSCSLVISSASAATSVRIGQKNGAACSLDENIDYDFIGYVEYNYFGVDTSSEYDYVLDLSSMFSYVTNRGIALDGTFYAAECNTNYGNTLNHYKYAMTSIPQGQTVYTCVDWDVISGWYNQDTLFRFDEDELIGITTGTVMSSWGYGDFAIGYINSYWFYDSSGGSRQSWWTEE